MIKRINKLVEKLLVSRQAITKWEADKQFFVIVTNEFIESRQLAEKITDKKFSIGNFSFTDCVIISDCEDS